MHGSKVSPRHIERQNDENFAEMADIVAAKILYDYRNLEIHSPQCLCMTEQLEHRIARALRAFHHREGHLEDIGDFADDVCNHHWRNIADNSVFDANWYCMKCGELD